MSLECTASTVPVVRQGARTIPRSLAAVVAVAATLGSAPAFAYEPATTGDRGSSPPAPGALVQQEPNVDTSAQGAGGRLPAEDPTGGAYTTPTLLFIPAGAVPVGTVRVITSLDVQGPTAADRLAYGSSLGFQPGLGGEVGLPEGFTIGAGTMWVGGDTSPTPVTGGISPYFQARYHVTGDGDGRGFQLGTSLTYKFVGFQGDPGEMELAFSGQYRQQHYEVGLQAVIGKDFATTDADSEFHAYAIYRVIPELGVGGAGQVRVAIVSQPGESTYDVIGGGIASLTLGRWQVAGLWGVSTIGLNQAQAGALGEVFATARF